MSLAVSPSTGMSFMSGEKFTLDTNILVYSVDRRAGNKHQQTIGLIEELTRCDCILTLQVLAEFYSAVTRKGKMPWTDAQDQVNDWMILFPVVSAEPGTIQRAMLAVAEHRFSFWDAMLLETAAQSGVTRFLSENMQHNRIWRGMVIENPFE